VKQSSFETSKPDIPKNKDDQVPHKADGNIYMCICRPTQNIVQGNAVDEDDEDAIEKLQTCI